MIEASLEWQTVCAGHAQGRVFKAVARNDSGNAHERTMTDAMSMVKAGVNMKAVFLLGILV